MLGISAMKIKITRNFARSSRNRTNHAQRKSSANIIFIVGGEIKLSLLRHASLYIQKIKVQSSVGIQKTEMELILPLRILNLMGSIVSPALRSRMLVVGHNVQSQGLNRRVPLAKLLHWLLKKSTSVTQLMRTGHAKYFTPIHYRLILPVRALLVSLMLDIVTQSLVLQNTQMH